MIKVEGLHKSYGKHQALSGVSFEISSGQVLGFLGPNGAGKTTAMKILTCYMEPTAGRASVNGHDCVTEPVEVRRHIGYLPETTPIYRDMIVTDYLNFIAEARGFRGTEQKRRVDRMIGMCALGEYRGYAVNELSKGYRQRVGLAQAMIHDPRILILDEPTSGLDPNQRIEIRNLIREVGRERTVILSTHILSEVELCSDRVLIINRGKIVKDTMVSQLRDMPGFYRVGVSTDLEKARRAYGAADWVAKVEDDDTEPGTLKLHLRDKAGRGGEIFDIAVREGLRLTAIEKVHDSLEDMFMKLTLEN